MAERTKLTVILNYGFPRGVFAKTILSFVIACSYLTIFSSRVVAQSAPAQNVAFQSITINDGLSQGMVNKILQDKYGFMWFATKDGLNQYDGYHFKIYRHDADDSTSLADSYVETMMEDSKGRLWVGTSSGYLDIFHHESGTFEHIQFTTGKQGEQKQGTVYPITEDTR